VITVTSNDAIKVTIYNCRNCHPSVRVRGVDAGREPLPTHFLAVYSVLKIRQL
jgi:hypothetical protein